MHDVAQPIDFIPAATPSTCTLRLHCTVIQAALRCTYLHRRILLKLRTDDGYTRVRELGSFDVTLTSILYFNFARGSALNTTLVQAWPETILGP